MFYSIYKHVVINIADPSNMQDACHMYFVIDLAHHGVSVAQWQSMGTKNFFLCPMFTTRWKTSFSISLLSSKPTISLILVTNNLFVYTKCLGMSW